MAKTRSQVKRKREKPAGRDGCDHVSVVLTEESTAVVLGTGYATFAWDSNRMADTPCFVCSICKKSTDLPGPAVKRDNHG